MTKFNEDTILRLEQAVRLGSTYEIAAKYAGISYETLRTWMREGEKAKTGKKKEFVARIQEAEGKAAMTWLARIEEAAADTWQAAAWKLERRYPEAYGRTRHEITGADGQPLPIAIINADPDDV